jgi:phosphoribosyl-AMP cyclohydrolase
MKDSGPRSALHLVDGLDELKWGENGLIPAVVVDENGSVLMVAYMNEESLERTIESGHTWFWSRSRSCFWEKGATSGNVQEVLEIRTDCDSDTLLVRVRQIGQGACHTGEYSCFFRELAKR